MMCMYITVLEKKKSELQLLLSSFLSWSPSLFGMCQFIGLHTCTNFLCSVVILLLGSVFLLLCPHYFVSLSCSCLLACQSHRIINIPRLGGVPYTFSLSNAWQSGFQITGKADKHEKGITDWIHVDKIMMNWIHSWHNNYLSFLNAIFESSGYYIMDSWKMNFIQTQIVRNQKQEQ